MGVETRWKALKVNGLRFCPGSQALSGTTISHLFLKVLKSSYLGGLEDCETDKLS